MDELKLRLKELGNTHNGQVAQEDLRLAWQVAEAIQLFDSAVAKVALSEDGGVELIYEDEASRTFIEIIGQNVFANHLDFEQVAK